MSRTYDLILWGATGFTGQLVAEYLQETYGDTLKWAIAGRNEAKLHLLQEQLQAPDLLLLVANSRDRVSLETLASQPRSSAHRRTYALYGSELVAACVAQGTHYCDLTGEVQWMRRMIDQHHEDAAAKGIKIVHSCGYDSIPSDMGVWYLQREAQRLHQEYCTHIRYRLRGAKGGFSGGTLASLGMP